MINELSIIIPTLNEEYYLPKLLSSIHDQDFSGKIEVIVVDGGSEDRTPQIAKEWQNKITSLTLIETGKGVARQRNRGADVAQYEHILFLDADVILPPTFISRLTSKKRKNKKFVEFALHLPKKPDFFDYVFAAAVFSYVFVSQIYEPLVIGSFIFTTKENHKTIGGFKEKIILAEDIDYGRRSIADGARYRFHFSPYVFASPRRLRREGRIKLLVKWVTCHFYIKRHGEIYDNSVFSYPMGDHPGDE